MAIVLTNQCGTDFSTNCGDLRLSFIRMLAACIVGYPCDLAGNIQYRVNMLPVTDNCDDLTPFWTCNNNGGMNDEVAERALVENTFALDDCGNLAWKVFVNLGEEQ